MSAAGIEGPVARGDGPLAGRKPVVDRVPA